MGLRSVSDEVIVTIAGSIGGLAGLSLDPQQIDTAPECWPSLRSIRVGTKGSGSNRVKINALLYPHIRTGHCGICSALISGPVSVIVQLAGTVG
jgi:hypothetical protein